MSQEGFVHQRRAVEIDPNHPIASPFLAASSSNAWVRYEEAIPYIEHAVAGGLKSCFGLSFCRSRPTGQTEPSRRSRVVHRFDLPPSGTCPRWIRRLSRAWIVRPGWLPGRVERVVENGEMRGGMLGVWSFSDLSAIIRASTPSCAGLGLAHVTAALQNSGSPCR